MSSNKLTNQTEMNGLSLEDLKEVSGGGYYQTSGGGDLGCSDFIVGIDDNGLITCNDCFGC